MKGHENMFNFWLEQVVNKELKFNHSQEKKLLESKRVSSQLFTI